MASMRIKREEKEVSTFENPTFGLLFNAREA